MSPTLQWIIVAVAVLLALQFVIRKYFPAWIKRQRQTLAIALLREPGPEWRRRLGQRIAPPSTGSKAGGCDDCNGCD